MRHLQRRNCLVCDAEGLGMTRGAAWRRKSWRETTAEEDEQAHRELCCQRIERADYRGYDEETQRRWAEALEEADRGATTDAGDRTGLPESRVPRIPKERKDMDGD